jgi:uncharacterized repeat protein (TIGR01451 family)
VTAPTNVADLSVTLTDAPDPVPAGSALTYTAKITNGGPDKATGVTFTEPIPAHTTFVSAKPATKCPAPTSGILTCSLGGMLPGNSVTVSLTLTPNQVGNVSATATVDATSADVDTGDLSASASSTVTDPDADLSIALADRPDPITLGSGYITYTIVATNGGPAPAAGVRIVDTLSASVVFVAAKPGAKCSLAGRVVTCKVGTLAPDTSSTATVVVNPAAAGSVSNSATVSSTSPDPDQSNDDRSVSTTVQAARRVARLPGQVR